MILHISGYISNTLNLGRIIDKNGSIDHGKWEKNKRGLTCTVAKTVQKKKKMRDMIKQALAI